MIFRSSLPIAIAIAALAGACGNYSNEDLEFMNALPDRDDLAAQIPTSALSPADEAELSKTTHETIRTFNGFLELLRIIDAIRTYPPTSRAPNVRVWGPVAADQAGWQWRMTMTRTDAQHFSYDLEFHRDIDPDDDFWHPFITGDFVASAGVHRGMGHFRADTAEVFANGFAVGKRGEDSHVHVIDMVYSTRDFPISVVMDIETSPKDVLTGEVNLTVRNTFHYEYEAQASGQGAMRFRVTGDLIPLTPVQEVLSVTARWLPSGAGRADAVIESGDGMGLTHSQCWDSSFRQTFNRKAWDTSMDFQDESFCPAIPKP
jgi:hypothetical protein